jgi:hypothetical protein
MPKSAAHARSVFALFDDDDPDFAPPADDYVRQMKRYIDDDWRFNRALAAMWNECALYEAPVRPWRDLAAAPVGCCKGAVQGDELALFVGLMAGVLVDFQPPPKPRQKRTKQPTTPAD